MKKLTNKTIGNGFEQEFCNLLGKNGFWAHNAAQNKSGQPADVFAVRNNTPYLIDCKVCELNTFKLCRVEENQQLAMERWIECGNDKAYFALKFGEEIYMLHYLLIIGFLSERKSVISLNTVRKLGVPFHLWVNVCA